MVKEILIILTLFSQLLFAEENAPTVFRDAGRNALIAPIETLSIQVNDNVTGGCFPNPSKLKDKLEIKLRKNGFKIENDPKKGYAIISVNLSGYKLSGNSCVVNISADLHSVAFTRVPYAPENDNMTVINISHYIGSYLLTGDRYSMQSRLEKRAEEYGDTLYLNISRAKDDTFDKFPSIQKRYEESKK